MTITDNDIHLWFACPDEITEHALLETYRNLMTDDERARMDRFKFHRHRHIYLISRAVMRVVLSYYDNQVAPEAWRFCSNAYGKPQIENPITEIPLVFNLSHTDGLIMFGVNLGNDIGVDVENMQRPMVDDRFISSYFAPDEVVEMRKQPELTAERFFEYWTLKEAYIKAKGMGLSIPLDSFWFRMAGEDTLTIAFESGASERPDHWHFWLMQPTATHKASIGYCTPNGERKQIFSRKIVPLKQITSYECKVLRRTKPLNN